MATTPRVSMGVSRPVCPLGTAETTGSARAAQPFPVLRLRGLDPALRYRVDGGEVHSGAALMYAGLSFPGFAGFAGFHLIL